MKSVKSAERLPIGIRDKPLYTHTTGVIDHVIDNNFTKISNISQNLYNPISPDYDADRMINMLGFKSLANIMSTIEDKVSLSLILSDISHIKGLRRGFELILRILDLKYKTVIYQQVEDGCTEVTLVFRNGERLTLNQISNLELLSREIFPLCISLRGMTNCDIYTKAIDYAHGPITLGQHRLSRDFILDMSKLDTAFGSTDGSISKSIHLLLCNTLVSDLVYTNEDTTFDTIVGNSIISDFIYNRNAPNILDHNLILDRFNFTDYYMFSTINGRVTAHDLIYLSNAFTVETKFGHQNIYSFILDNTLLDTADLNPLDGHPNFSWNSPALDNQIYLDRTNLDSSIKHTTNHIELKRHMSHSEFIPEIKCDIGSTMDSSGSLDFSKRFNSSYTSIVF